MQVTDQLHRVIEIPDNPLKIVSLVPSQTELLVSLGLRDKLVGITKFCVHPTDLRNTVTVVGGTKSVHYDKIETLQPDIILCNKEENTQEMVDRLSQIASVWISDIFTVDDALEMISAFGSMFKVTTNASKLIATIKTEIRSFSEFMEGKAFKKVAYVIWKRPYMLAGRYTFINELLKLNRYENCIVDGDSRYPEVSLSALNNVDLILLASEPFPFKESDVVEIKNALNKEVRLVDGEYFSWYGSRLATAFQYFKTLHQ